MFMGSQRPHYPVYRLPDTSRKLRPGTTFSRMAWRRPKSKEGSLIQKGCPRQYVVGHSTWPVCIRIAANVHITSKPFASPTPRSCGSSSLPQSKTAVHRESTGQRNRPCGPLKFPRGLVPSGLTRRPGLLRARATMQRPLKAWRAATPTSIVKEGGCTST